jgi:Undecaprenyl-phosphate glucose phosphotransferase
VSHVSSNARAEDRGSIVEPLSLSTSAPGEGAAPRFRVPYHLVEPIVLVADLFLIIAISLVAGIGYNWFFLGVVPIGLVQTYAAIGLLTFINVSAISAARGNYRIATLLSFSRQARDLIFIWTCVLFVFIAVAFALKAAETFSRGATFSFFVLGLSGMLAWRGLLAQLLQHALSTGGFAARNVILIAEKTRLSGSRQILELRRCGYTPIKTLEIVDEELRKNNLSGHLRAIVDQAAKVAKTDSSAEIFLLLGWEHSRTIRSISNMLRSVPIPVYLLPDDNITRYLDRPMMTVGTTWAAEIQRLPLTRIEQFVKRCFDLVGASLALLLFSPLMLITALLIKLDSSGAVLFRQTRDGFNGRRFQILKFRTMNVLEDGAVIRQVTRADPRVTRIGRLLRRTSVDELPQLFNVLTGSMSLVGPRPHAIAHNNEYEQIIANYAFRHHVKPGITGWAQVHQLRGATPGTKLMAKRVEYDLWYIDNWSLWLDFKILLRTLFTVLQSGAY